jgi:hypothetical protein
MTFRSIFTFSLFLLGTLALSGCELATFGSNGFEERGDIDIYWSAPTERANGDPMNITEIGGYEIRYRSEKEKHYNTIIIRNTAVNQYSLEDIDLNSTRIEVAVFDTDGIYSDFVLAAEN